MKLLSADSESLSFLMVVVVTTDSVLLSLLRVDAMTGMVWHSIDNITTRYMVITVTDNIIYLPVQCNC